MNEILLSVRLTKADAEKLKKQAHKLGLSKSTLARMFIKQGLNK